MALDEAQNSSQRDDDHTGLGRQGSGLSYAVLKQPALGWVTNNGDGTFDFDPGADFRDLGVGETRQVIFDYQASDGWGGTEAARAIVTVTGTGDGTLAIDVSYGGRLEDDEPRPPAADTDQVPDPDAEPGVSVFPLAGDDATPGPALAAVEDLGTRSDAAAGRLSGGLAPDDRAIDASQVAEAFEEIGPDQNFSRRATAGARPLYTVLAQPSEGRVLPNEDGTFDFLPEAGFPELAVGELYQVTFTCRVADEGAQANTTIAALTIIGTSDGPVVSDVSFRRAQAVSAPQQAVVSDVDTGETNSASGARGVKGRGRPGRPSLIDSATLTTQEPTDAMNSAAGGNDELRARSHNQPVSKPSSADLKPHAPADPDEEPDGPALAEGTNVNPMDLTDFTLSNDTVLENCEPGALVGQVVIPGSVDSGGFIYDLQRDADGRFDINPRTGKITVADGAGLEHGAEPSHDLLIQVIDSGGVSRRKSFTIKVLPAASQHADLPAVDARPAQASDVPVREGDAPDATLGEAEVRKETLVGVGEAVIFGNVHEAQAGTADRRHDVLRLDGMAGGPDTGGWTLELSEGVIVTRTDDHILLSGNSLGNIRFDDTAIQVSFRGIERIEW